MAAMNCLKSAARLSTSTLAGATKDKFKDCPGM